VREGAVDLVLSPDVLVEPIPETPESFAEARAALHPTMPTDGHQGIVPSDAPKSQLIPGMAFAAEDGSLEADKKKRKGKKPKAVAESFIRGAAATDGSEYYVLGPGRNLTVVRQDGKLQGIDSLGTRFPLSDTTELYPMRPTISGMGPSASVSETLEAKAEALPVAPTKVDFEPPANLPTLTSQTQVDELRAKIALLEAGVPSAKVLHDSPAADEAVNALLAAAEALADSLLARLKGRRIVITIE
jgi:hypothetical protein